MDETTRPLTPPHKGKAAKPQPGYAFYTCIVCGGQFQAPELHRLPMNPERKGERLIPSHCSHHMVKELPDELDPRVKQMRETY